MSASQIDRRGFEDFLAGRGLLPPQRARVRTLQLNIGLRCNLACHHCHVESGPKRREAMGRDGVERILELLEKNPQVEVLDVTGGAPELNPHFRFLVTGARALSRRVIDRCNLTVFYEPGQQDTPEFLAAHEVEVVASLPCTTAENVEAQRGRGVFGSSITALQWLNRLGYGQAGSHLRLDLVYNPGGPTLPPETRELEALYRVDLEKHYGIRFHRLIAIANMPIKRFARELARTGKQAEYMELLAKSFNPDTLDTLMCRATLSVDHEGRLFDCDFNQALGIGAGAWSGARTIWDSEDLSVLENTAIATARHCLGCTAGAGSSCGGALVVPFRNGDSEARVRNGDSEARVRDGANEARAGELAAEAADR